MPTQATERIAEALRKLIVTGELSPGKLTSEAHLCSVLECGRTPLREALQCLSHESLVELPPHRGILIPELSILDFYEAAEAVIRTGVIDAELAAQRITDEQLSVLRRIVVEQRQHDAAARVYEVAELDRQFHTLLAQATGNRYFAETAHRLHSSLERFSYHAWVIIGSAGRSIDEHDLIVEALAQRDPVLSKERLQHHVELGRQRVLLILGLADRGTPDPEVLAQESAGLGSYDAA